MFAQEERLLFFIIHFIHYFLFYANPLPSFIPSSLNLHNRQVDDRTAGEEEVLLKGVVVDVEAEEMEEEAVDEQHFILWFREVFDVQTYSWWDTRTQFLFGEVNGMHKFS